MTDLQHILARAARRDRLQRLLRRGGTGLAGGLVAANLLLLVDRGLALALPPLAFLAPAAAGGLAGLVAAMLAAPSRLTLAVRLDRTYGLKDRVATAGFLATDAARTTGRADDDFAALVRHDAERCVRGLDVRAATPIRPPRVWGGAAALAIALGLGVRYLPAAGGADEDDARVAARTETRQRQRAELTRSLEETLAEVEDEASLDEDSLEALEALEALAAQLDAEGDAPTDLDPEAAREASVARLSELADRLEDQARRDAASADELTRRFAGIETPRTPMSAEAFTEALKRGDFGEASDRLEEMLADAENGDDAERRAAAEHLRDVGRQLAAADEVSDVGAEERRELLRQVLRDEGLDEPAIDELLAGDESGPDDVDDTQRELEQRNVDEEIARDLARALDEIRRREAIDEQADRDARETIESLERAARTLQPPPATADEPPTTPPATPPPMGEPPTATPGPTPPSGETPQQTPREQPTPSGETPQQTPREQPTPSGETPQQTPREQPTPSGETPQPTPREQPTPSGETPQQTPREQPDASGETQTPTPREQPDASGETPPQTPREQPSPSGETPPQTPREQPAPSGETPPQTPREQPAPSGETPPQTPREQPAPSGETPPQTPREQPAPSGETPPQTPREQPAPSGETPQMTRESPDGSGRERIADDRDAPAPGDVLREIEQRRRRSEQRGRSAERSREAARRLAEDMTDEQRRRWAERWRPAPESAAGGMRAGEEGGPPPEPGPPPPPARITGTEDLPLGSEEIGDELIAEWLSDQPLEDRRPGADGAAGPRLRRIQRAAQQAVDESAVPTRYHRLIKRYFGGLGETVGRAAATPSPGPVPGAVPGDAPADTPADPPPADTPPADPGREP